MLCSFEKKIIKEKGGSWHDEFLEVFVDTKLGFHEHREKMKAPN